MALAKIAQRVVIEKLKWGVGLFERRSVSKCNSLTPPDYWEYQNSQLLRRYKDAVGHIPWYRDRPDLYPRNIDDLGDPFATLRQLPILSKEDVKSENEKFWRVPPLIGTGEHTTGGTTGAPLRIRAGLRERGFTNAILEERYLRVSGTRTPRILRLNGFIDKNSGDENIFVRIPGTKFGYMSIYALHPSNRERITSILQSFQPQIIHGYASAIHQLALLYRDNPLTSNTAPFVVVSTSETLLPNQRDEIEGILKTRVFDEYGSQEGQHLVLECDHRSMHIHPARGIVEILHPDRDSPVSSGEVGRVVVTGLASPTMPLFRYDLGDTALSTGFDATCACGIQWPTIGTVQGRLEDLVRTRDGRRIGLISHSTLKDVQGIRESQVVQTDFEDFTYRIVPQSMESIDRRSIEGHVLKELRNRLQVDVTVRFEYVSELPRTSSGKLRAVVVEMMD